MRIFPRFRRSSAHAAASSLRPPERYPARPSRRAYREVRPHPASRRSSPRARLPHCIHSSGCDRLGEKMDASYRGRSLAALLQPYNLAAVARAIHVSPSTVYRWRDGHAKPTANRLQVLARFLRIDANEILLDEEDDDMPRDNTEE